MGFRNDEVNNTVSLLNAGVITRSEARELLGISETKNTPDESNKSKIQALAAELAETRAYVERLREILNPFSEYAKAIPDNWKDTQPLTITLDMPPHTRDHRGTTILDIAIGAKAFRDALEALSNSNAKEASKL